MLPTTHAPSRPATGTHRPVRRGPALVVVVALAILSVGLLVGHVVDRHDRHHTDHRDHGAHRRHYRHRSATDPPRVRHRAGERGVRRHLRRPGGRSLPGHHPAGVGGHPHPVLRDRALLERQLHRPHLGPGAESRPTSPTARCSPTSRPGTPVGSGRPDRRLGLRLPAPRCRPSPTRLDAAHLTWKAYMQDMGNVPSRESAVCGHPAVGAVDHTQLAVPGDGYATRHDPFVYFHSIIDDTAAVRLPCGPARLHRRYPAGLGTGGHHGARHRPGLGRRPPRT